MTDVVNRTLDTFLAEADAGLAGSYSAVLYGSAARGQFVPGVSDLNLILILDDVTPGRLRALGRAFRALRKEGLPPPLLATRGEWSRSADAFPIEISDIRSAYRVLRGSDPIAGLKVSPADLRRALEREFRGKLMRLRQGYVASAEQSKALGELVRLSVGSVLVLLRVLLGLLGREAPGDPLALVAAAASAIGFDPQALARIAQHRGEPRWNCSTEDFLGYLTAVEAAARFTDELHTGEWK